MVNKQLTLEEVVTNYNSSEEIPEEFCTIENLAWALGKIKDGTFKVEIVDDYYIKPHPGVTSFSETLAYMLLISRHGTVDREACQELSNRGFHVSRGEFDSFGWLTGVIRISNAYLVFG